MTRGLVGIALCVLWLTSAAAELSQVELGLKAWKRSDHTTARQHWQQASRDGDPQAMFLLSQLLERGEGGPVDPEAALTWLRAAAEGGYAPAQFNLGSRYQQGDGVTRDLKLAAHWWRQAALQGLAPAQFNLGSFYYQGMGVPRDLQQARLWYEQAAEQGSGRAKQILAKMAEREQPPADAASPAVTAEAPAVAASPPEQAPEHLQAAALPPALQGLALGPDWLARQPADAYTLQILATRNLDAVKRFLRQHRFNRQVVVFPFKRGEHDWYAVLYGRFASPAQARAAVSGLPKGLRRNAPWVRRLAEFQPAAPQP